MDFSAKPHTFLLSWPAVRVFVYSRFAHVAMMEKPKKERKLDTQKSKEKKENRFLSRIEP